jgi:COP9 signalosome complex subunit 2
MMQELYTKSLATSSAVAHPKILGVIRECGGKMYMNESKYEQAQAEFYKAFEDYDEAADPRRLQCLKYGSPISALAGVRG